MKKNLLFLAGILVSIFATSQTKIPAYFCGMNYWFPTAVDANWNTVANSGVKLMRYGGIDPNTTNPLQLQQIVKFIDDARAQGIEPELQIPFQPKDINPGWPNYQPFWVANARKLVYEINVVRKKGVKYWCIANEPNGSIPDGYGYNANTTVEAQKISDYIRALSTQMKDADPNILIAGPTLNHMQPTMYGFFLSDPNLTPYSIAGTIKEGAGINKYFIDRISFNTYPWPGGGIITNDWVTEYPQVGFTNNLTTLFGYFAGCSRTLNDLKIAITEANMTEGAANAAISWLTPGEITGGTNNNSFLAGQYRADFIANALNQADILGNSKVDFINFWSVQEGLPLTTGNNLGYFHTASSSCLKPSFHHFKEFSKNFNGKFFMGNVSGAGVQVTSASGPVIGNVKKVKAFASADAKQITVMILNEGSNQLDFDLVLGPGSPTSTQPLMIAFPGLSVSKEYFFNASNPNAFQRSYFSMPPNSSAVLIFNCSGDIADFKKYEMSNAAADAAISNPDVGFVQVPSFSSLSMIPALFTTITSVEATCSGLNNGSATLNSLHASASVNWVKVGSTSSEGTGASITGKSPGAYIAEMTMSGCSAESFKQLVVINGKSAPVVPDLSNQAVCSSGNTITFNATALGAGLKDYVWTSTGGYSSTGSALVTPPVSGSPETFNVTVTHNPTNGCSTTRSAIGTITSLLNDAYIKDEATDNGTEPNPLPNLWDIVNGNDVWVRNFADVNNANVPEQHFKNEHLHQNVEFTSKWASDQFFLPRVYVKVRNRSCNAVAGEVRIYYHKLSTNDHWGSCNPNELCNVWQQILCDDKNGNDIIDGSESNSCPGYNQITLQPGQETVIEQVWYSAKNIVNPGTAGKQYCLLVRFISGADGMSPPEGTGISAANNADTENNIVQKNVWFYDNTSGIICNEVNFGNVSTARTVNKLEIEDESETPFTGTQGLVKVDLGETVFNEWVSGGRNGSGFVYGKNKYLHASPSGKSHFHEYTRPDPKPYEIHLTERTAVLQNIGLNPGLIPLCINQDWYTPPAVIPTYTYSIRQYESTNTNNISYVATGGVQMLINKLECPDVNAGNDITVGRGCQAQLTASPNIPNAIYTWRNDKTGDLVGTGSTINVSPKVTTSYELELRTPENCVDFDIVTVTVNNSVACQTPCGAVDYDQVTLSSNTTINNQSIVVKGILRVPTGITLTIIDSKVSFIENAEIDVKPGGRLIISNSKMLICDITKKWKGITIKGNNTDINQLNISGTTLSDAVTPLSLDRVLNPSITDNIFDNGTTAITMDKCQKFIIQKNQFFTYNVGIHVMNTLANSGSLIKENSFTNVKTAVLIEGGNNSTLDVACNTFDYEDYAVYSNNTTLKNQGTSSEGAGNVFYSNSTNVNHKLRHNGNSVTYYYDPSNPVVLVTSSGMAVSTQAATTDGSCIQMNARIFSNGEDSESNNAIGSANQTDFNIFPNPFSSSFTIMTPDFESSIIEVYNAIGSIIYSKNVEAEKTEIDLSKYSSGIYFVRMTNSKGSAIKKIIKG